MALQKRQHGFIDRDYFLFRMSLLLVVFLCSYVNIAKTPAHSYYLSSSSINKFSNKTQEERATPSDTTLQPINETRNESHQDIITNHHFFCEALKLHESGNWQHQYFSPNATNYVDSQQQTSLSLFWNTTSLQNTYLPREIDWLQGKNLPALSKGCNKFGRGTMYTSQMGNQCSPWCQGLKSFQPSHSVWMAQNMNNDDATSAWTTSAPTTENNRAKNSNNSLQQLSRRIPDSNSSPSLRLIQRLAMHNDTLCFAGDSIDFQIYDALLNNLRRIQRLQTVLNRSDDYFHDVKIHDENFDTPVNYTKEYGEGAEWIKGWMVMDLIRETKVTLERTGGNNSTSTFRWYKTYGYPVWNFEFMKDCSIVVFNLGLHYGARGSDMSNSYYGPHKLYDDFRGAINFLVDFVAAKENRTVVWRSALPQHFDTVDGHYENGAKNCSSKPLEVINSTRGQVIQNYNKAYDEAFSKLCDDTPQNETPPLQNPPCGHLEHRCTINRTSMDYPTVYKFLFDNNFTKHIERFRDGSENDIVTGEILRWNIADLFDVGQWHISDCSHFCYIPPLYEAAFERLLLLLDYHRGP